MLDSFWQYWVDRFQTESEKYITPCDRYVVEHASNIDYTVLDTDYEKAFSAWEYFYDNLEYSLSRTWKPPRQTINEGVGDCEDFTFLLASVLPNLDVYDQRVKVGYLVHPSGAREEHTWNEVGGNVVDLTAAPKDMSGITYEEIADFEIRVTGECPDTIQT